MDVLVKKSVKNSKETNTDNNTDCKPEQINGGFDVKNNEYKLNGSENTFFSIKCDVHFTHK